MHLEKDFGLHVFGTTSVSLVCSCASEDRTAKTQKEESKLQTKQPHFNSNQINAKAKFQGEAEIKLTANNPVLPQKKHFIIIRQHFLILYMNTAMPSFSLKFLSIVKRDPQLKMSFLN